MRILGIDPGYGITGFGLIEAQRGASQLLRCGAITTPAGADFSYRLEMIYEDMRQLLEVAKPEAVAIEELFFGHNVTTAIGVALSSELGGIAAITTAAIIITGIFGNIIGPALCRLFRLDDPVAQGAAFGTAAHVIGTTRAMEMNALAGAVSSLALTLAGIITCILMSFLAQYV